MHVPEGWTVRASYRWRSAVEQRASPGDTHSTKSRQRRLVRGSDPRRDSLLKRERNAGYSTGSRESVKSETMRSEMTQMLPGGRVV